MRKIGYWLVVIIILGLLAACANDGSDAEDGTPAGTQPLATLDNDALIIPPTSPVTPRPGSEGESDASEPEAVSTPIPTATETAIPTPTPLPSDRLALGLRYVETGNFGDGITQLTAGFGQGLSDAEEQQARYALGEAYLATGQFQAAAEKSRLLHGRGLFRVHQGIMN